MKLLNSAFTLLSLLSLAVAGTIPLEKREEVTVDASKIDYTDNLNALKSALKAQGKTPENGKRYGLYEKWAIEGKPVCYEHWTHWVLVVGEYQDNQFKGSSYSMFKDGDATLLKSLAGATTQAVAQEHWWANHYWKEVKKNEGEWVANTATHQYDLAGEVVAGAMGSFESVTKLAENYVKEKTHTKYNVATNNCHDFAEAIYEKIKK
ncbi:hypothetical protein N0V93_008363 [Gnomoniopsis smithogilvyi]|uniref:Uncharacterized protein n=1 Tax=Gnomoniopsis smithogilvyi TaxID=1191159 RepID=A0A9W8YQ58_9PEZI|nr:hypothetical protein N0V93_008363 [Gnomoniopsis smithogilvyi]